MVQTAICRVEKAAECGEMGTAANKQSPCVKHTKEITAYVY
jgi:hypothetical protein